MAAFLRPALHYRRPGLFDLSTWLVCTLLAELLVVLAFDDNLHPDRPTHVVAPATGELVDLLVRVAGPPLVLLLLALVVLFGRFGELVLGLVGLGAGVLLIAATVGSGGIALYLYCVVVLRVMVWVLHVVLAFPLRLIAVLIGFALLLWLVTG